MNWELEKNFCDKFGIGVPGSTSTPLNSSVGGTILADPCFKHGYMCFIVMVGKRQCCGSRNFVFLGSSMLYVTINSLLIVCKHCSLSASIVHS
ncbi:hypothetical protein RDI58_024223 [Solanum bulbocastanum]|uniref:Uncharacterized protein n=1 Tax=Solanum bulbocastanum TaxID=147425 RepID=A0AAN8Y3E1_SOLBU